MHWVCAGIGISIALVVSVLFAAGALAEGRGFFKRGAESPETQRAIHAAFDNADYGAYVAAMDEAHRRSVLTEEAFDAHAERIARKRQINDAFTAGDYSAYLVLTEGSIRQLTEPAFRKKATMLELKAAMRAAMADRDFAAFTEKKQALRDLLGDEFMDRGHGKEMTEERFNRIADRIEEHGDLHAHGRHGFGKSSNLRW